MLSDAFWCFLPLVWSNIGQHKNPCRSRSLAGMAKEMAGWGHGQSWYFWQKSNIFSSPKPIVGRAMYDVDLWDIFLFLCFWHQRLQQFHSIACTGRPLQIASGYRGGRRGTWGTRELIRSLFGACSELIRSLWESNPPIQRFGVCWF